MLWDELLLNCLKKGIKYYGPNNVLTHALDTPTHFGQVRVRGQHTTHHNYFHYHISLINNEMNELKENVAIMMSKIELRPQQHPPTLDVNKIGLSRLWGNKLKMLLLR